MNRVSALTQGCFPPRSRLLFSPPWFVSHKKATSDQRRCREGERRDQAVDLAVGKGIG